MLLATGSCTPPLANFLSSTLGEAGLRRMARSTDASLSGLHTAILERLMPLAELVLFLLGELRGAVLAAGAESWLGLQVGMSGLDELHRRPATAVAVEGCVVHRGRRWGVALQALLFAAGAPAPCAGSGWGGVDWVAVVHIRT
jgi:hypothetical protein